MRYDILKRAYFSGIKTVFSRKAGWMPIVETARVAHFDEWTKTKAGAAWKAADEAHSALWRPYLFNGEADGDIAIDEYLTSMPVPEDYGYTLPDWLK